VETLPSTVALLMIAQRGDDALAMLIPK